LVILVLLVLTAGAVLVRAHFRRQSLKEDIHDALGEGKLRYKEFRDQMVADLDNVSKIKGRAYDTRRIIAAWQSHLHKARAGWEKVDNLARAEPGLVDAELAGRIQVLGEKLQEHETCLGGVEERVERRELNVNGLHLVTIALGESYCNRGDILLFRKKNPKVAYACYARAFQILRIHQPGLGVRGWSHDRFLNHSRRGRQAASFLLRGFTGRLNHFPVITFEGTLSVEEKEVPFGFGTPMRKVTYPRPGVNETKVVGLQWNVTKNVHELPMRAGRVYLISQESHGFRPRLRLENSLGELLAETRCIDDGYPPANPPFDSRIIFRPKEKGTYRIVAGSEGSQRKSGYTLKIHTVARGK
jgi:hypothetical protein